MAKFLARVCSAKHLECVARTSEESEGQPVPYSVESVHRTSGRGLNSARGTSLSGSRANAFSRIVSKATQSCSAAVRRTAHRRSLTHDYERDARAPGERTARARPDEVRESTTSLRWSLMTSLTSPSDRQTGPHLDLESPQRANDGRKCCTLHRFVASLSLSIASSCNRFARLDLRQTKSEVSRSQTPQLALFLVVELTTTMNHSARTEISHANHRLVEVAQRPSH